MTFTNTILIAVALFAILAAAGAFTIAFRRARSERPSDPTDGVSAETIKADRSMEGVEVVAVEPEPEADVVQSVEEGDEEPQLEPAGVGVAVIEEQRIVEVTPEEGGVTRRQFFNRAITATFGSFMGLMGLYSLVFTWPKLSGGFGTDVDAGELGEVQGSVFAADGSILPLFVPEARAYVVPSPTNLSKQFEGRRVEAGGLMALFQRCVHLGCRVPWCGPSQGFECPCHGSKYNSIGEYFAGPAPRNLDRFEVEVVGGRFIIKTGSIVETPRASALSSAYPRGPSCIGATAEA
ncbi:MAG: ubiquinol-cytochrome c reductase iron-sulfur subunit [Acidimicrobiia bacterium]|nr:ubiquinol-cytochrome c reductase iron-sulfur subunit [Acidimicrobiia bacterium]